MGTAKQKPSSARQRRYLRRAKLQCSTDPFNALSNVHKLLDGGVHTAEVYHLQATLLLQLGCGSYAAQSAEKALQAGGDRLTLLLLMLKCHLTAYNRKPAAKIIEYIMDMAPLPISAQEDVAHGAQEIHQYPLAERLYEELLSGDSDNPKYLINLGYAYQKNGEKKKAVDCYRKAINSNPDSANGYRLLTSAQKQTADENDLDLLKKVMPNFEAQSSEYATGAYALGKIFEDIGDFSNAFHHFKAGADVMRPKWPYGTAGAKYSSEITMKYFEHPSRCKKISVVDSNEESDKPLSVKVKPGPLFILGMPRTGSTLLDRMLGNHPEIISMGELGCFKEAMKVLTGFAGGDGFHNHFYQQSDRVIDLDRLGHLYREAAGPEDFPGTYFIDKYPMNFMDLGLIADALPEARFIHTIRNPLDTVFANYKQIYTLGFYHYSYTLQECAEYYICYHEIMKFWRHREPHRILDIYYEEMIHNTETLARRVLKFLDLDWDENCLHPQKNKSPVDTASLSQVRQPIYKTAIDHWKNYEPYLQDVKNILEQAGIGTDTWTEGGYGVGASQCT